MNIKFPAGISLFICLFCTSVFAEQLQVDSVYTDKKDEVSFIITLPKEIETTPEASNFQLLDGTNKVLRQQADAIESFEKSQRGFDLLLCIDVSGSIRNTLPGIRDALIDRLNYFKAYPEKNKFRFGIVSFANEVIPVKFTDDSDSLEFTDDSDSLKNSIRKLQSIGKYTRLYDAVFQSLDMLIKDRHAEYRRILVISDGKDEGSDKKAEDVIDLYRRYGIPIYAIAQGDIQKQYSESLGRLADATGGHFTSNTPNLKDALKNTIIQIHKNFMTNSWVVYFRYQSDPEKSENAVIRFHQNDRSWSTTLSKGIPMPKVEEPPPPISVWERCIIFLSNLNWDKWKIIFLYFGLGLILIALLFVFWKFRQRKEDNNIGTGGDTDTIKNGVEPGLKPDTQPINKPKPRLTEVSDTFKVPQKSQNQPNLALVVLEGPLKGQKIPINKQLFRIGADLDNDLALIDDDYISGNHALLRYDKGELLLSDQHSLNGTLLNSELVKDRAAIVLPGDVIQIGKSSLKLMET